MSAVLHTLDVYRFMQENPGCTSADISRTFSASVTSVTHILTKMKYRGHAVSVRSGGRLRWTATEVQPLFRSSPEADELGILGNRMLSEMDPGKYYSVRRFAERFGVTENTALNALRILRSNGMVHYHRNRRGWEKC